MITIRHRTASGPLEACWEYDSARRAIELVLQLTDSEPIPLTVRVCAIDKPRLWCHPIMRLDAESWRILPAIWGRAPDSDDVGETPTLVPLECVARGDEIIACSLHREVGSGAQIVLTQAPSTIDLELEYLSL